MQAKEILFQTKDALFVFDGRPVVHIRALVAGFAKLDPDLSILGKREFERGSTPPLLIGPDDRTRRLGSKREDEPPGSCGFRTSCVCCLGSGFGLHLPLFFLSFFCKQDRIKVFRSEIRKRWWRRAADQKAFAFGQMFVPEEADPCGKTDAEKQESEEPKFGRGLGRRGRTRRMR